MSHAPIPYFADTTESNLSISGRFVRFLSLSATLFIVIISNLSLLSWLALPSPESCALLHFLPNLVYFNSSSHYYERPRYHMEPPEYCSSSEIEHELLNAWAVFCYDCLQRKYPANTPNSPNSLSSLGLDSIKSVGVNELLTGTVANLQGSFEGCF